MKTTTKFGIPDKLKPSGATDTLCYSTHTDTKHKTAQRNSTQDVYRRTQKHSRLSTKKVND